MTVVTSFDRLVWELREFDQRRAIVKAMSKGLRSTLPAVRKQIRAAAIETLPSTNGLGKWVAKARINMTVKTSGRRTGVRLVGGRNSSDGRSDLTAIDRGRVRAPSWGRRGVGQWHTQTVQPGYFRETAANMTEWRDRVDAEVDRALDTLRRG